MSCSFKYKELKASFQCSLLLFFITLISIFSSVLAGNCCTQPMVSFSSGEAFPDECLKLACTDDIILVVNPNVNHRLIWNFAFEATQISTLTVISNRGKPLEFNKLERIVHHGSGPAIRFFDADIASISFVNLKEIIVDEPLIYCQKRDLIVFESQISQVVMDRLKKIARKTLAVCDGPTVPPTSPTTVPLKTTTSKRTRRPPKPTTTKKGPTKSTKKTTTEEPFDSPDLSPQNPSETSTGASDDSSTTESAAAARRRWKEEREKKCISDDLVGAGVFLLIFLLAAVISLTLLSIYLYSNKEKEKSTTDASISNSYLSPASPKI
ncbi:unnamed protein product [Caenorhabditis auriculariae]|uniref:Uncharacterized protein n=1 Tax=Caenorhabditis auriculariae TaxID=2777116 RepID=A0A8S1H0R3_9PELO|nr:unnamed protein product [Caenorhabditis auriculariae]